MFDVAVGVQATLELCRSFWRSSVWPELTVWFNTDGALQGEYLHTYTVGRVF